MQNLFRCPDKTELENAPSFDKGNWPNMADHRWGSSIHTFFQATPYWEEARERMETATPGIS